ncbi:MAG: VOC family protein [Planctomycetota bacterium]
MPQRTGYRPGEFCWVDLASHGIDETADFYQTLFGWSCEKQDTQGGPPYGIFCSGGKEVGGLGELNDEMKAQGVPASWNTYVNVESVEDTIAKATASGATIVVPAMQIMDSGWLAFLQDPTGGVFALWQKNQHFGSAVRDEPVSATWHELATRDNDAAKKFYGPLFGWEFGPNPDSPSPYDIISMDGEQRGGFLQMTEEWGEIPPHWTVYFNVEDVDATAAKAAEIGGRINCPAFDIPVGRIAMLADCHGAAFTVIQLNSQKE